MSTTAPATRERLLSAARGVIEQRGYGAATVLAIADRAGLATGTLYRHFASKEELFVEVFRAVCAHEEAATTAAREALGPDASPVAGLEEVLATFAQRALRNPRLAWALLAEPVDPLVDAERLAYRARYTGQVAAALRAAIRDGEIAALDASFTAAAVVGGCWEALVGPLAPAGAAGARSGQRSSREAVAALRAFVRRAIGAPPLSAGATRSSDPAEEGR